MTKQTVFCNKGDYVWISNDGSKDNKVPYAGKVTDKWANIIKITRDDGKDEEVGVSRILSVIGNDASCTSTVDDMVSLTDLQEHSILRNIQLRYYQGNIYTYIGWILIGVNPYRSLPIYSEKEMTRYQDKRLGELPPHIYAVGAQAVNNLRTNNNNQCILISGETGAGKTESTKLLLKFVASVSCKDPNISKKIIQANPILEAFGNAKTTENDNSSRFGKYIELAFDDGFITGARVQHFLLEKSRVKHQNKGDRNYHVFYLLFSGLTSQQKALLHLTTLSNYNYLRKGGEKLNSDKKEELEFKNLKKSLVELMFSEDEIWSIFKLLAVVIHLGNFSFRPLNIDNNDATEVVKCESLKAVVNLLNIPEQMLLDALTQKNIFVGGQHLKSFLTPDHACSNRDSFATTVYSHIFSFVLNKINKIIHSHDSEKRSSIGILDIFGFENFINNSFEQLCINYSNEFLQQFFVENVFKIEQAEYEKESIPWKHLEFSDNQATLEMLGLESSCIIKLIEEQTKLPQGNDRSFLVKCNQIYSRHPSYIASKAESSLQFGIKHYAGPVIYNVKGMIEKNRSELSCEWQQVIATSDSQLMKALFANQATPSKRSSVALTQQYCKSLDGLMKTLSLANPFFIRCLKPNLDKKPMVFDHSFSCRQLQYFGFMATVMIRKAGFSVRYTFTEFVNKYHPLLKEKILKCKNKQIGDGSSKGTTVLICKTFLKDSEYRLGKTKVFLKTHHDFALESIRNNRYTASATIIQRHFRRRLALKRNEDMRRAALLIQKHWRMHRDRRSFLAIRYSIMYLQSKFRSKLLSHIFSKNRLTIIHLQARCRGFLLRTEVKKRGRKGKLKTSRVLPGEKDSEGIGTWITDIFEDAVRRKPDNQAQDIKVRKDLDNKYLRERECFIEDDTLSFSKFAASYFIGNIGYKYSNKPLEQPLLFHKGINDCWASSVLWVTILRFMGDLPEPDNSTKHKPVDPVMKNLYSTLPKSYVNSMQYQKALKALEMEEMNLKSGGGQEEAAHKIIHLTLLHKSKLESEVRRGLMEATALRASYDDWLLNKKTTRLEKVHFIIGHAILRSDLRDEVYCQLMKLVTENPNKGSELRGWILLSLCASCFAPTERLAPTLIRFFSKSGNRLSSLSRLLRTLDNGTRTQPPTNLELEAVQKKSDIVLEISLLDDSVLRIHADPATTSQEICTLISDHLGMTDRFGFSLFLIIRGEELSLEAGGYHVMDGISQCEQYAKENGLEESSSPWLLVFKKEMFSPWQFLTPKEDPVSASLVYHQVLKGLRAGQYRASSDSELASVVAQHYYLNYHLRMFSDVITNIVQEIIPGSILKNASMNYWIQLVKEKLNKNYFIREKLPEKFVKQNLALYCKNAWPLLFSKVYDTTQVGGISLGPTSVLLAINSDGVYFAGTSAEILLKIPYVELLSCTKRESMKEGSTLVSICTIFRSQFVFETHYAHLIVKLVNDILIQLTKRSNYAVAVQRFKPPDESFLDLNEGDLVILYDGSRDKEWLRGRKQDGEWAEFPLSSVKLLPTLTRPSTSVLEHHVKCVKQPMEGNTHDRLSLVLKKHSLENYFAKHSGSWRRKESKGCRHSNTLLNSPIHSDLSNSKDGLEAITMFSSILNLMGDKSANKSVSYLTVLEKPLNNERLRDEFYCQTVKQLTDNPSKPSEDRGWKMMWLASGLFPCTHRLLPDVREFLLSRPSVISQEIASRLDRLLERGSRTHLCHPMELSTVENKVPMAIDIALPNGAERRFEVESWSRVQDLIDSVAEWLDIKILHGFNLAFKFKQDVVFLHRNDFILDSLQTTLNSLVSFYSITKEEREDLFLRPKLHFMKQIWIYSIPGSDERADSVCHYYQELNKYLAGLYSCSLQEVIELAAFILLSEGANFDSEMKQNLINNLSNYVPVDFVDKCELRDWVIKVGTVHKKCQAFSKKKAKEFFLKFLYKLELYGSAYFNIKQMESGKAVDILLAVNSNGIYCINPTDKRILKKVLYPAIQTCSFSNNVFHLKLIDNRVFTWQTPCMPRAIYDIINAYFQQK